MESVLLTDIPYQLEFAEVKNRLHLASDDETTNRMAEILERVREIARPKALYREAFIDERGEGCVKIADQTFRSRVLHSNLANVFRVFPYVATCGVEIDAYSAANEDILERYWLDGIKEILVRQAVQFLRDSLQKTSRCPR